MGGSNLVNSWTQTKLRVDLSQTWTKVQNIENSFNLASYLLISRGTPWVPETELHLWSHLQVFVMIILSFSYFEYHSFALFSYFEYYSLVMIMITIFILWMLFLCDYDHSFHTLSALLLWLSWSLFSYFECPPPLFLSPSSSISRFLTHLECTFPSTFQVW